MNEAMPCVPCHACGVASACEGAFIDFSSSCSADCAVHAGRRSLEPAQPPFVRLPGRFLTAPSLVSPVRAPSAKPGSASTVPDAPRQAHSHRNTVSSPCQNVMRNSLERDQQQEDIIYAMWTSGSTGNAKAVCGTATGGSSLLRPHLDGAPDELSSS